MINVNMMIRNPTGISVTILAYYNNLLICALKVVLYMEVETFPAYLFRKNNGKKALLDTQRCGGKSCLPVFYELGLGQTFSLGVQLVGASCQWI